MMDIVICNMAFWSAYILIGTIPYRIMQKAIDNA